MFTHEYINVPYMPMYTNTIFSDTNICVCALHCAISLPPACFSVFVTFSGSSAV